MAIPDGAGHKQLVSATERSLREAIRENKTLRSRVEELERGPVSPDLASLDEHIETPATCLDKFLAERQRFGMDLTWREIFWDIAPYLQAHPNEDVVLSSFLQTLRKKAGRVDTFRYSEFTIDDQAFRTIGIQLKAHGLVDIAYTQTTTGGMALIWT